MNERTMRSTMPTAAALVAMLPILAFGSEGSEKPGLFTGDIGNIIWTLITFLAVVVVLGRFAWKPILTALQKREEFIRDSLEQARKERQQAELRLKEYTEQLNKAREEATAIVEEGRRDAEEVRKRIHAEAKAEADAIAGRAKREIEMARDAAVKQLHDQTILLATTVAGKIVRKELTLGDHQELVDQALAEIGKLD